MLGCMSIKAVGLATGKREAMMGQALCTSVMTFGREIELRGRGEGPWR